MMIYAVIPLQYLSFPWFLPPPSLPITPLFVSLYRFSDAVVSSSHLLSSSALEKQTRNRFSGLTRICPELERPRRSVRHRGSAFTEPTCQQLSGLPPSIHRTDALPRAVHARGSAAPPGGPLPPTTCNARSPHTRRAWVWTDTRWDSGPRMPSRSPAAVSPQNGSSERSWSSCSRAPACPSCCSPC